MDFILPLVCKSLFFIDNDEQRFPFFKGGIKCWIIFCFKIKVTDIELKKIYFVLMKLLFFTVWYFLYNKFWSLKTVSHFLYTTFFLLVIMVLYLKRISKLAAGCSFVYQWAKDVHSCGVNRFQISTCVNNFMEEIELLILTFHKWKDLTYSENEHIATTPCQLLGCCRSLSIWGDPITEHLPIIDFLLTCA